MNVKEAGELLLLIGDESRLTIVKSLTKKLHMCAKDFLPVVNCKQATLSHHLNELVESGLLRAKKSGNKVMYSLDARKFEALTTFLGSIERVNKKEVVAPTPEVVEETKPVEEVKPVQEVKPIEEVKPVEAPKVEPVVEEEKPKGSPVKIELPIYLL